LNLLTNLAVYFLTTSFVYFEKFRCSIFVSKLYLLYQWKLFWLHVQ